MISQGKFRDFLISSLPEDMSAAEFGADSLSGTESEIINALANCQRLNWGAYLANYPDVRASGLDPADHFVRYGIYEGRRLMSWHPFRTSETGSGPKVSVIISNYNNELSLSKCVESLLGQTLEDIEIIAVDDASKDGSLRLLQGYTAWDRRVKILALPHNQSLHMTRMNAVPKALGQYIMFVDSDDFYESNACETAYNEITKGWDIVAFNLKFVNHSTESESTVLNWEKWYNGLPAGVYSGERLYNLAFEDYDLPCLMWSKIYEKQFLQGCFAQMEPGYHNLYEDLYEFLVISRNARHIRKIDAKLVNYSFGTGITTGGQSENTVKSPTAHSAILVPIKKYSSSNNIEEKTDYVRHFLFKSLLKYVAKLAPEAIESYFQDMVANYGPLYSAVQLMREYFNRMEELAAKFQHIRSNQEALTGKIMFFAWNTPSLNKMRDSIENVWQYFSEYSEVLLVGMGLPEAGGQKIRLLNKPGDISQTETHLASLYRLLVKERPSSVVFLDAYDPAIFWDVILLRFLNIRVCSLYQGDVTAERKTPGLSHKKLLTSLKCVDRIICLEEFSRNYLSAIDIGCIMSGSENVRQAGRSAYGNIIKAFCLKAKSNFKHAVAG